MGAIAITLALPELRKNGCRLVTMSFAPCFDADKAILSALV
jgi:hypothetical protein